MEANLYGATIGLVGTTDEDQEVDLGVILNEGGWQDWMLDTALDANVYFYLDSLEDLDNLQLGDDIGDGFVVKAIDKTPYYKSEEVEPTKTIFRKYLDGDIIALFVEMTADSSPDNCLSYMHMGQHGSANPMHVIQDTKPATEPEYADLKAELERSVGYIIEVVDKHYRRYYVKRREALAQYKEFSWQIP